MLFILILDMQSTQMKPLPEIVRTLSEVMARREGRLALYGMNSGEMSFGDPGPPDESYLIMYRKLDSKPNSSGPKYGTVGMVTQVKRDSTRISLVGVSEVSDSCKGYYVEDRAEIMRALGLRESP